MWLCAIVNITANTVPFPLLVHTAQLKTTYIIINIDNLRNLQMDNKQNKKNTILVYVAGSK